MITLLSLSVMAEQSYKSHSEKEPQYIVTSGISLGLASPKDDVVFVAEASVDAITFFGKEKDFPFNWWGGGYGSVGSFNGSDIRAEIGVQGGYMIFGMGAGYTQILTDHGNEHGFSIHSKFVFPIVVPYIRYSRYDSYQYIEGGISLKLPLPIGYNWLW